MKYIILLLAILTSAQDLKAQKEAAGYRCLPCGSNCDKELLAAAGKCDHCGMPLVPASTVKFTEVIPSVICDYISSHPGIILLDVRTKAEYENKDRTHFGTLKTAINIPVQELEARLSELDQYKDKEILVFCSHSHRSPQAAYLLSQRGFNKVVNLSGGMSALVDKTCVK
jgi:rhodanese-related sulfurtransferase